MKHLIGLVFTIATLSTFGQFGFQRTTDVDVIKEGLVQNHGWVGGLDYCQFSNIDLDFDGVEDLFIFDKTCDKVLTFLQKGEDGEIDYEYAPEYEEIFPDDLFGWVLLVDYDCDGKKDIFTRVFGSARIFRNTGNEADGLSFELKKPFLTRFVGAVESIMYVGPQDIPAITDVDGDGDTDILTFGNPGIAVEYFKNMSMETYGVCDSIVFELKNKCWGRFREHSATNEVTLWDTLETPCTSDDITEEFPPEIPNPYSGDRTGRHEGGSLLALDMDNSGVLDLVVGDVSYTNLTLLLNSGTEVNTNSGMDEQDNAFPSESVPVDLPVSPAAYYVDINDDNVRDLIVSPTSKIGAQNIESVWYYINEGEDTEPDFVYQGQSFLQEEMIDAGTSSLPVFFDHDGDGLKDLLVSSHGQYDPVSGNQISKIAYYHNSGTEAEPEFTFITDDYQGLSTKEIGTSLVFYPTFGDLDGDGDEDMILGEFSGYCYFMENTGGPGNPAIFNTFITLMDNEGALIFEGTFAFPYLVDLDRDEDLDLVIGRRDGTLQYYENISLGDDYEFELTNSNLGGVDVTGDGSVEGYAIPQFIDIEGEYHLLVGSKEGNIYYYDGIDDNLDESFNLVEPRLDNIYIGTFSAPAVYNINGNNRYEMVLGNRRGGVVLYESAPTSNIGIEEEDLSTVKVYPNPAEDLVFVSIESESFTNTLITIYSIDGQEMYSAYPTQSTYEIDLSRFSAGAYIIEIKGESIGGAIRKKLVVR